MTTITAAAGQDTWTESANPNTRHGTGNKIKCGSSQQGFAMIPVAGVRGRTVLSATLTGHINGTPTATSVAVARALGSWDAGNLTWNNRPPSSGTVGTATVPAGTVDGAAISFDVTSAMTTVANGGSWYGFSFLATGVADFYSFDSDQLSWTLVVDVSDAPEQPTDLRPNGPTGANFVGSPRPILAWSFVDLGGASSEQGAFQVQVDPAANGTTPAFATGWITSPDPQYDLSSGTFTALAAGGATQWRVQTRDAAGMTSVWSDWAAFGYRPLPSLVVDSPTGGTIGDPTPTILAHLASGTLAQYRVRVASGNDRTDILYHSGLRPPDGTTIATVIPFRDSDGKRIIRRDDVAYQINVRAFDSYARVPAVGMPAYVEQWVSVTFNEGVNAAPSGLTVTPVAPGDPRLQFQFFRTTAAEKWPIYDDGELYAIPTAADVAITDGGAGYYTWVDNGLATPYKKHVFAMRAIDNGSRSVKSNEYAVTPQPEGVWIIAEGEDPIVFDGIASLDQWTTQDRRATYPMLNGGRDVDIVYGFQGVSGSFAGSIDADSTNVHKTIAILKRLRTRVNARPTLLAGTFAAPVILRNLSAVVAADFDGDNLLHNVTFDFIQDGD